MNNHAKEWVAALRSGEYKQCNNYLHRISPDGEETFCCLGVACALAAKAKVVSRSERPNATDSGTVIGYGEFQEHALLPSEVQDWLGLSTADGRYYTDPADNWKHTLVGLNDSGDSFDKIANVIEAEPKGLFNV